MKISLSIFTAFVLLAASSCERTEEVDSSVDGSSVKGEVLLRVGSETVTEADLQYFLTKKYGSNAMPGAQEEAFAILARRAQLTSAASAAGLRDDPVFRAEVARLLIKRHREQALDPDLKRLARTPIPEAELRERYEAEKPRFQSGEKREVAVLWLNPGNNPERRTSYLKKLETARLWLGENKDLQAHPERGFGNLSIDHSEHPASRHKGGGIGLLEEQGGIDSWTQTVAGIAFTIPEVGEVSEVITRPEGLFLVRFLSKRAAVLRPFEAVKSRLENEERASRRKAKEAEFEAEIFNNHPIEGDLQKAAETAGSQFINS
jgi:hypothetical protein